MPSYEVKTSWGLAAVAVAAALAGCGGSDSPSGPPASAKVVSSRPDMVSQGSALVRIDVPKVDNALPATVSARGMDVTAQFKAAGDGSLLGLVSGLPDGKNTISVSFNGATTTLDVVSHGRNGPIISGPHQTPWICQTADFLLPDGSKLGAAQDASCNAPTKVQYYYMPITGAAFKLMASPTQVPADVKTTTTSDGRSVNYIVRLETGTLNRGIYQFAMLYDPTTEAAPSPTTAYKGWNRKVVYTFGGSAQAGYIQGRMTGGVMNDLFLSQGFGVVSSSLNVFGNNENDVLSAETVSMTKEQFIKTFGVPIYTMGWGGSGGSMQQHLIANNYPGLLDGITPSSSFSDLLSIVPNVSDCSLIDRAFQGSSQTWTDAQKTAVSGFKDYASCTGSQPPLLGWLPTFSPGWLVAKRTAPVPLASAGLDLTNCMVDIPEGLIYDPVTNPKGARCDAYSSMVNQIGIEPSTGYAARAIDNVGVQYGLKAYQGGTITAEQFVDLNERVGGYNGDGVLQAARTVGSNVGLNAVYAFGRFNQAKNLGDIPVIDNRAYQDPDIHNAVRSISTRQRIVKANGAAPNHVILRGPGLSATVLKGMDAWLSNIVKDTKSYPSQAAKVTANKPADVVDACYTSTGTKIAETADINNGGQCGALYPYFGNPRIAAGGPVSDEVLKCQLQPLQQANYPGMSNALFARLQAVFPNGVCDYSKASVGYQPLQSTWLSYPTPGKPITLSAAP